MRRLVAQARLVLGRGWLPAAVISLALLLVSPCLAVGPFLDDFLLRARVDPSLHVPGFAFAPFDLFDFASGEPSQRALLLEEGAFAWWTAPDLRLALWRPFSSATHVLDQLLWPRSSALAHAQSMLWFAALLSVLAVLYRRFHVPPIAHLALLLYAVDDARGMVLGWTANRNALVAATLAFAALLVHDRARRDAWRLGRWLAPVLFAAALLGGEAALAVTGYLLAHALFVEQGRLVRRLARLWPYAALSLTWLLAYGALGYGTTGSGIYVNPLNEPLPYLRALLERLPVLLSAQLGLSVSDAWLLLPPKVRAAAYALALLVLFLLGMVLAPLWRRLPVCRFWLLGAMLSVLPLCAAFPMDRLLVFPGVGAMAAIAVVFAEWREGGILASLPRARRALVGVAVPLLALLHLVLAPLLLPARVMGVSFLAAAFERVDASIPRDPAVCGRTLVVVSAPADGTVAYTPLRRAALGIPRPHHLRLLVTGRGSVRVTRLDDRTLRVRPERGFLSSEGERMVRGLSRPFRPGDEVLLSDLRVRVREVTRDGRPAEVDFAFEVPLEDPSLLWMWFRGGVLVPWSPPAPGESRLLPGSSFLDSWRGRPGPRV